MCGFRVGTAGYQYDHWAGVFYPEDIAKDEWFGHYAKHFDTCEINNTFYGLPEISTFDDWYDRAPEGFLYVLKFSRYGSHMKKLKDPQGTINTFMERATHLHEKLGPILLQLPPNWYADPGRLNSFLAETPSDTRWAVEFRDPGWLCDEIYEILREHRAALCIHDKIEDHPRQITADWIYVRFHGGPDGCYSPQALSASAQHIQDYLSDGLDVYAFFNNDAHGLAVENAMNLRRYVRGGQ
ncbi:MAG: DUF72 domain-containing protein [Armatimonadota bacterium]